MLELKTEAIADTSLDDFVEVAQLLSSVELEMVAGGHATVNNV